MHFITYSLLRFFGFLVCLLPYRGIHAFGRFAGTCAYYLHRPFRKKSAHQFSHCVWKLQK